MKEIIGDNHEIFRTRSRKAEIVNQRQLIYYYAYEKYHGPTVIQQYLKDTYGFSVNQSTIYHSWRKIGSMFEELSPRQYEKEYNIKDKYELADKYAAYQLSRHQDGNFRADIKHKINRIMSRYEGMGRFEK